MHTKGPWKTEGFGKVIVNSAEGFTIVGCPGGAPMCPLAEHQANARLIAAAPEMLEALETILATYPEQFTIDTARLRTIVAKVKGEEKP